MTGPDLARLTREQRLFRADVNRNVDSIRMDNDIPWPIFSGEQEPHPVADALRTLDEVISEPRPGPPVDLIGPLSVRLEDDRLTRQKFLIATGMLVSTQYIEPFKSIPVDTLTRVDYRLLRTYFGRVALVEEAKIEDITFIEATYQAVGIPPRAGRIHT